MDHRIRRATYGEQNTERVFQRLVIDNLAWPAFGADKSNSRAPRLLCDAQTVGVDCRYCRRASRHHAESLCDRSHRACGAHHRTSAGSRGEPSLYGVNFTIRDLSGAVAGPEAPAIGARPKPFAMIAARRHWSGYKLCRREIGRVRTHELGRHRLVATTNKNHRVHRLSADHLLDIDRHEVAELETCRDEEELTKRNGWKLDGQRTGRKDAALYGLDQFRDMTMAIVESARRTTNADNRPI